MLPQKIVQSIWLSSFEYTYKKCWHHTTAGWSEVKYKAHCTSQYVSALKDFKLAAVAQGMCVARLSRLHTKTSRAAVL